MLLRSSSELHQVLVTLMAVQAMRYDVHFWFMCMASLVFTLVQCSFVV